MKGETRRAVYDEALGVEAYRLEGFARPFPNHFHEYYVIGYVERGRRILSCKNRKWGIAQGSVMLLNPGDNHACAQSGAGALDYCGLNIPAKVMLDWARDIADRRELPEFSRSAVREAQVAACFCALHKGIMGGAEDFARREALVMLLSTLIQGDDGSALDRRAPSCDREVERACEYMESHYASHVDLDQLCLYAGMGKSTLLRAFARAKGVTPYRYLESVRIGEAQKRLRQGTSILDAAMQTGFSDQSHFTNCFKRFTGLVPGAYRDLFRGEK